MKLIIGLGNIGAEYVNTRHNVGFLCLDHWAAKHKYSFSHDTTFDFIKKSSVCCIKPNTYMNRSGLALSEAKRRWKISDYLVIHDDIELPLAKLRIRNGGGDGGHNGLKSLFDVQPPEDLKRIRVGIGRNEDEPRDYVLDCFQDEERETLQTSLQKVTELIDIYIKHDFSAVLNQYSIWNKSYSGAKATGIICPKEEDSD